jgi:hypothetical protein
MLMAMSTKAIGLRTKLMVMEFINIWMGLNTKDTGKKINKTEEESRGGQMVQVTKVIMCKAKKMERVFLRGQTAVFIMASLQTIISMAVANISGPTDVSMKALGKLIKWTEKEFFRGLTVEFILGNMLTIKRKGTAVSNGLMEGSTLVHGIMESNMDEGPTCQQTEKKNKASGAKEKG